MEVGTTTVILEQRKRFLSSHVSKTQEIREQPPRGRLLNKTSNLARWQRNVRKAR